MHLPDHFAVETVTIYPSTQKGSRWSLPPENGEESLEKKNKTTDTNVVFHISLAKDDLISSCYLSGMSVPQYESVSIYNDASDAQLVYVKRSDIERTVESSYGEERLSAYRKMSGLGYRVFGVSTITYHPVLIPYQEVNFDTTGFPVVRIRDQAREFLIRISREIKRLRFEFEMPFGWSGDCTLKINIVKPYQQVNEFGYPTN